MTTILTLTMNSTVDISMTVDALNDEGKTRARIDNVRGGGGGINVARCIGKLGGNATALYTTGPDVGRRLDHLLEEEELNRIPIHIGDDTREAFVVAETATGRSYHLVPPGPWLTERDVDRCLEIVSAAAQDVPFLVITGSMPRGVPAEFCAEVIRQVRPLGTRVILDIAGPQLAAALPERAYLVRLDRHEASALIGKPIHGFADAHQANDHLLNLDAAEIAVTTVGPVGTVCSSDGYHYDIAAPPMPGPARSDACAGDSLIAAIAHELAAGVDVVHACEVGVAAAAATVLRPGTETFDQDTLELLRAQTRAERMPRTRLAQPVV
jgi:6-phosphofructokinase 2